MIANGQLAKKVRSILVDMAEGRKTDEARVAYSILVEVAKMDETTIRYGDLADRVGVLPMGRFSGVADKCLHPISAYCVLNGFPDITSLVVGSDGFPSRQSSFNRETIALTWQAVRTFPWPTRLE